MTAVAGASSFATISVSSTSSFCGHLCGRGGRARSRQLLELRGGHCYQPADLHEHLCRPPVDLFGPRLEFAINRRLVDNLQLSSGQAELCNPPPRGPSPAPRRPSSPHGQRPRPPRPTDRNWSSSSSSDGSVASASTRPSATAIGTPRYILRITPSQHASIVVGGTAERSYAIFFHDFGRLSMKRPQTLVSRRALSVFDTYRFDFSSLALKDHRTLTRPRPDGGGPDGG